MKYNLKLYLASLIITVTVMTGILLMPFAEYNSSRYMSGEPEKMTEISFDEEALTVGVFGEKITVPASDIQKQTQTLEKLVPFLPNELRVSAKILEALSKYMGEAE